MITFRLRPSDDTEWDSATFAGDNEDMLAHLFTQFISDNWEVQVSVGGEPFQSSLDWEEE